MKKFFKKIHLWLSVPFGIFITLVCFSGAMMVFEKEITEQCRKEVYFVKEQGTQPLPLDVLMEKISATLPDSVSVTGLNISPDSKRTWQASLSKPRRASVYVNQYTGEVTGKYERLGFFDVMFHMHRWLMGSNSRPDGGIPWGKTIVGVSTLLLVFIIISGIIIWWPRNGKVLKERLKIHIGQGWPRFWHDLHVAGGVYATIFILIMALTGLTWSFTWYRNGFYSLFGVEAQAGGSGAHGAAEAKQPANGREATVHADGSHRQEGGREAGEAEREGRHVARNHEGRQQAGSMERNQRPEGGREVGETGREGRKQDGSMEGKRRTENGRQHDEAREDGRAGEHGGERHHGHSPYAHWQQVYEQVAAQNQGYRLITVSDGSIGVVPKGRNSMRATDKYQFDRRTGEITGVSYYKDQDRSGKVRSAVYTLHTGSWGGLLTRILAFLSALLGATLPLTGYYLWIRRLICKKRGIPHHGPHHGPHEGPHSR